MIPSFAYAQTITELKSKAEDGDVQAQLSLAKAYHLGEGVAKDEGEAVRWLEKAANQGDAAAQINLGNAYEFGTGVPKNYAAAVRWFTKAADQGAAEGQRGLALQYHLGQGVPKDDAEAMRWYTKAADQGNAQAQSDLAVLYHLGGQGVPQDDAAAVNWWKKAANQGDATAQGNLGTAYGLGIGAPKDEVESMRWHTKAAENGNPASQFTLGMFYVRGARVPKDEAEGVKWLRKAAEQGFAQAQYNLGMAYRAGSGVEKDNVQAYFWIALAATSLEQGVVKDYRDKVGAVLTPVQLADVQERIREWKEAHPAAQTASLNFLPGVPPDQHQAQPQAQPSIPLIALGIKPVFLAFTKPPTCDGKLASVLLSSFKEAITTSQRHELIRDLSDNGKMDTILMIQMACEERNNSVSVTSTYGEAKCFGPKNCHVAFDPRTGNVLSCDPNGEPICGKELFKEFEYILATTGIDVRLE